MAYIAIVEYEVAKKLLLICDKSVIIVIKMNIHMYYLGILSPDISKKILESRSSIIIM